MIIDNIWNFGEEVIELRCDVIFNYGKSDVLFMILLVEIIFEIIIEV